MKKISWILFFLFLTFSGLVICDFAFAVCPICTVAVGVGVGLCRYLGIDDLISGAWIGGMIVSMIFWALDWLTKKNIRFKFREFITPVLFYLMVIIPLYLKEIIGHPFNKFLGVDKLLFGIISGSAVFLAGVLLNNFLKKQNKNKVLFPYQKVVLPILALIILSVLFYLTC